MKVRKTITMDENIARVLEANNLRHGDVTWHVENALTAYFKELSPKPKKEVKAVARFTPPNVNEVAAYCMERGNSINAQSFVDHYTGNGWRRGQTKIKDWKACVRTWENRDKGGSYGKQKQSLSQRSGNAREELFAQIDAQEATSGLLGEDDQPLRLQVD